MVRSRVHQETVAGRETIVIDEIPYQVVQNRLVLPRMETDGIVSVSAMGMIVRDPAKTISRIGRATQGVRLVNLKQGDRLIAAARVVVPPRARFIAASIRDAATGVARNSRGTSAAAAAPTATKQRRLRAAPGLPSLAAAGAGPAR